MAYTAFRKMRKTNKARFGVDLGPMQPPVNRGRRKHDLKSAALRFLRKRSEGLRHDEQIAREEKRDGVYRGMSLSAGQIPYNMQMDVDRLCLEKTLGDFIDTGSAVDAYSVYFCYINMFLGKYGESKKMVELLSEYEANGSSLLMKHRDHYSLPCTCSRWDWPSMKPMRAILGGRENAVEDYLSFLKAGRSADPQTLLSIAGVDPLKEEAYRAAMDYFKGLVDEYERLVDARLQE